MRISDWSSDVCSSDLVKIGRDGQFGRIASAVLPNAAQIGVDADYRSILTEARRDLGQVVGALNRSEEHTSELQSLMRISYAVFCLKKTNNPPSFAVPASQVTIPTKM